MKSLVLETSTMMVNTSTTTSYDDSDDELGAEIYRTSLTAQRFREEQEQTSASSTQTAATRRRSSRLKNTKSKDAKKEKTLQIVHNCRVHDGIPISTDNRNIKQVSSSSNKKRVTVSDDKICHEVTGNIKRVFRNGRYHHLCSSAGCTSIARGKEGVCKRHGAKVRKYTCTHIGCNNHAQKGGVCIKHGAKVKRKMCNHKGCINLAMKGGVCFRHGAKRKTCSHKGCNKQVQNRGVCIRHGAKVKTCSHEGCNNHAKKGGVCKRHGSR